MGANQCEKMQCAIFLLTAAVGLESHWSPDEPHALRVHRVRGSLKILLAFPDGVTYTRGMRKTTARLPPEALAYFVEMGSLGGKKGGPARAAAMTKEERSESARKAVQARWNKAKGAQTSIAREVRPAR